MNVVKVRRKELLEKFHANLKDHRDVFLKAQDGYRIQVIEELERRLQEARHGQHIRRGMSLPEPADHTKDYNREISMLEMSVDDVIELSAHDFDMYVMDNWSWKQDFTQTSARYLSK